MTKETLEEASRKYATNNSTEPISFDECAYVDFKEGAKWQAKISYSDEEVFIIIDKAFHIYASSHRHDAKEWFEQFKKQRQ